MNDTSLTSLENEQFKDTKLTDVHFSDGEDMNEVEKVAKKYVKRLLEIEAELKSVIATNINFSTPMLTQGKHGIIHPHTINLVQGQAGVHKSRVAENICSALLSLPGVENHLGFTKNTLEHIHVLYVDTERNLKDQLPYALQQIVIKAGYQKESPPHNFSYISLMKIKRKKRFKALKQYIEHLRSITADHLFVVLDVVTDCIPDFNSTGDTLKLIDHMNVAVNENNCTFLCIIHENPNSEKARGHLGTELMNKATTVMQVGYEKNNKLTVLIEVKFRKTRMGIIPPSIYCLYSDVVNGLVLAEGSEVAELIPKKQKSAVEDLVETLAVYFEGVELEMTPNGKLLQKLCNDFSCNGEAMRKRLNAVVSAEMPILINEMPYKLVKEKQHREIYFKIVPVES